jgi:hypothetical protein
MGATGIDQMQEQHQSERPGQYATACLDPYQPTSYIARVFKKCAYNALKDE